jgi:hypothetical protein
MGSVEGRVAIQYVHPYFPHTSFLQRYLTSVFRYVDEKDSQYVPHPSISLGHASADS